MYKHVSHTETNQTEGEVDVEEAFGEHDIAYWVRDGNRLVPATPAQIAAIQEHEALLRLALWRAHSNAHPLHITPLRIRHIGLYLRHAFSLTFDHPRLFDTQHTTLTTDSHPDTPLTEPQPKRA